MIVSSPFASECSRGESLQKTTLDLRDIAGETFRLRRDMAGKKSERVTFGRGNVFPQVLHVAGFFPVENPYSTTESGQDPVQPDFPTLDGRATSNRCHAMYTTNKNLTRNES